MKPNFIDAVVVLLEHSQFSFALMNLTSEVITNMIQFKNLLPFELREIFF